MMSEIPKGFGRIKDRDSKIADAEIARIGLIAELDAINLYEQLAAEATDPLLRKALLDIAHEEKEHVGEFLELLKRLDPKQIEALEHGKKEIDEMEPKR